MSGEYEQMELDTRSEAEQEITRICENSISTVHGLIVNCKEHPPMVKNRHEAYGHAAEQLAKITRVVKGIKDDTGKLLNSLSDRNIPAIDAVSDICNSTTLVVAITIRAAAEMRRILNDLYVSENFGGEKTPMEEMTDGDFEEVEQVNPADETSGDEKMEE